MNLADELASAERTNMFFDSGCDACRVIDAAAGDEKTALVRAFAGTIGAQRLSKILASHQIMVSARQIMNHRQESEPRP